MTAHDPIGSDGLTAAERGDFLQRFQSAHDPRVTLTEAEVDRLAQHLKDRALSHPNGAILDPRVWESSARWWAEQTATVFADLIAARLAPIRALEQQFRHRAETDPEHDADVWAKAAARLRAALTPLSPNPLDAPQDAPRGPVGGEQGAEACWSCDGLGSLRGGQHDGEACPACTEEGKR